MARPRKTETGHATGTYIGGEMLTDIVYLLELGTQYLPASISEYSKLLYKCRLSELQRKNRRLKLREEIRAYKARKEANDNQNGENQTQNTV